MLANKMKTKGPVVKNGAGTKKHRKVKVKANTMDGGIPSKKSSNKKVKGQSY
jgi:hypothetical protein